MPSRFPLSSPSRVDSLTMAMGYCPVQVWRWSSLEERDESTSGFGPSLSVSSPLQGTIPIHFTAEKGSSTC